jgi:hypothetical protein
MKKLFLSIFVLCAMFLFSGCAIAGDIFKAGVWVGIIIVVAIIALVIFLIRKGTGNS